MNTKTRRYIGQIPGSYFVNFAGYSSASLLHWLVSLRGCLSASNTLQVNRLPPSVFTL